MVTIRVPSNQSLKRDADIIQMIKSQITLQEALGREFCPLCRMVREAEERLVWFILYESTGDRKLRAEWDREKGFCKQHNKLITMTINRGRLLSGSSIARVYETILDTHINDLRAMDRNSRPRNSLNHGNCFFCQRKQELEESGASKFTSSLQDGEIRKMYMFSDGLCIPHFNLALTGLSKREQKESRQFLLEDQISRLEKLRRNIMELQRKERYDVKETPTPQERTSWEEALWRFSGVNFDHPLIWSEKTGRPV